MTDVTIPLSAVMAGVTIFTVFVFAPLMAIEKHFAAIEKHFASVETSIATLTSIIQNCPYCMRKE